jgi:hypothetical protein
VQSFDFSLVPGDGSRFGKHDSMNMEKTRFYRCYAESLDGEIGTCFYEVTGNLVTKQIWSFGEHLFWASPLGCKDETHGFTDQPEWNEGDGAIDLAKCDRETFLRVWSESGGPASSFSQDD